MKTTLTSTVSISLEQVFQQTIRKNKKHFIEILKERGYEDPTGIVEQLLMPPKKNKKT